MTPRLWWALALVVAVSGPAAAADPAYLMPDAPAAQERASDGADCDECTFVKSCLASRPLGDLYGIAEFLVWRTSGVRIPLLVTSSPIGTPRTAAGVIGNPATRVAFGDESILDSYRPGFRLGLGVWLNDARSCGIEGSFFYICETNRRANFSSAGDPGLFRPFTSAVTGAPATELVAFIDPGTGAVLSGGVGVNAKTELYGFDLTGVITCCCTPGGRLDFLFGYRQLNLRDALVIDEALTATAIGVGAAPAGTTFKITDQFRAKSTFFGLNAGVRGEMTDGRWSAAVATTLALGANHNVVDIGGLTTITPPGGTPTTLRGGLLALSTNIGHHDDVTFAVVSETKLTIGYDVTPHVRVFTGYSFLYWSNVVRAGQQIDTVVNPTYLPNSFGPLDPVRPVFTRHETDIWAHGWNLGVQVGW